MGGGAAVLEVDEVSKAYAGRPALAEVSLEVTPGEVCGLLGPNGAGKTTLVSIVAALRSPDAGTVRVGGRDVAGGGRAVRSAIGLAAQETGIYPTVTVRGNLELFAGLAGLGRAEGTRRIEELAAVLELGHLMDRQARHLSGGEKRRLHTAMAMVHRPQLLMLDEPTTGVDIATRGRLLEAIARLAAEEGCAVLYSTHYLPEVEQLGASVAILEAGRILVRGSLADLVATHGTGVVELTFDGPAPAVPGAEVEGSTARILTDEAPGPLAAAAIGALGADADRLVSVDLVRPSLETVFVALTGRAYRSDDEPESLPAVEEEQP